MALYIPNKKIGEKSAEILLKMEITDSFSASFEGNHDPDLLADESLAADTRVASVQKQSDKKAHNFWNRYYAKICKHLWTFPAK